MSNLMSGLIIAAFSVYMFRMGILRILRRDDLQVAPRHRSASIGITAFIVAVALFGCFVSLTYFQK